jgi:hypothetical protein
VGAATRNPQNFRVNLVCAAHPVQPGCDAAGALGIRVHSAFSQLHWSQWCDRGAARRKGRHAHVRP